jgi:hypothetical protein
MAGWESHTLLFFFLGLSAKLVDCSCGAHNAGVGAVTVSLFRGVVLPGGPVGPVKTSHGTASPEAPQRNAFWLTARLVLGDSLARPVGLVLGDSLARPVGLVLGDSLARPVGNGGEVWVLPSRIKGRSESNAEVGESGNP